jgi:hypothetical protein
MRSHAPRQSASGTIDGMAALLRTPDGIRFGVSDGLRYETRREAKAAAARYRAALRRVHEVRAATRTQLSTTGRWQIVMWLAKGRPPQTYG